MAQTSITLTASMRSNLSSLKSIQKQMDTTQERLSTGKKVNSAIDNASSYYQARSLTNRASDLDGLLDSMGQGIQTIQAANEGIEAVTAFVEQLKSIATSAFALDPNNTETYQTSIDSYKAQYDKIIEEIKNLVEDSSYQGVNLLTGGELTVTFNETRSNRFTIKGDDIVEKMNLSSAESWAKSEANVTLSEDFIITPGVTIAKDSDTYTHTTSSDVVVVGSDGKSYNIKDTDNVVEYTGVAVDPDDDTTWTAGTVADDIVVVDEVKVTKGSQVYTLDGKDYVQSGADYYDMATKTKLADSTGIEAKTQTPSYAADIDASLDELSIAVDYLRSYATELGNNYSVIETRQDFTDALIDVLETGSDNLVLADMNEESANYLALQTRQQLAVNSLSLASQSAQSVLSLF